MSQVLRLGEATPLTREDLLGLPESFPSSKWGYPIWFLPRKSRTGYSSFPTVRFANKSLATDVTFVSNVLTSETTMTSLSKLYKRPVYASPRGRPPWPSYQTHLSRVEWSLASSLWIIKLRLVFIYRVGPIPNFYYLKFFLNSDSTVLAYNNKNRLY